MLGDLSGFSDKWRKGQPVHYFWMFTLKHVSGNELFTGQHTQAVGVEWTQETFSVCIQAGQDVRLHFPD